jgi:hypothetical protein
MRGGDGLGGQSANFAQGQGESGFGRQQRMAAGEDQAQPVVLDLVVAEPGRFGGFGGRQLVGKLGAGLRGLPEGVDGFEPACRNQPRAGVGGNALNRPLLDGSPERFLKGVFRAVEVAEQPDQRRQNPTGFLLVDPVDFFFRGQSQSRPPVWYSVTRVSKKFFSFERSVDWLIQGKGFSRS